MVVESCYETVVLWKKYGIFNHSDCTNNTCTSSNQPKLGHGWKEPEEILPFAEELLVIGGCWGRESVYLGWDHW